jgi:hypothetical protein
LSIAEAIRDILGEPVHTVRPDTGGAKSPLLYRTKEPVGYGILHFDRFIVDTARIPATKPRDKLRLGKNHRTSWLLHQNGRIMGETVASGLRFLREPLKPEREYRFLVRNRVDGDSTFMQSHNLF